MSEDVVANEWISLYRRVARQYPWLLLQSSPTTFLMLVYGYYLRHKRFFTATLHRLDFNNLPIPAFTLFRFHTCDIRLLANCLRLPEYIVTSNRDVATSTEALALVLARLASPAGWWHLRKVFGRSVGGMCGIFLRTLELMGQLWGHRITTPNIRLLSEVADDYVHAFREKSGINDLFVWGFIDGTLRPTNNPTGGNQCLYNGKDRVPGLKFQV